MNGGTASLNQPSRWISALIFVLAVGTMGWLRLVVFSQTYVTLSYALPLLICLAHKDKLLLWAMSVAFGIMTTYKAFWILGKSAPVDLAQWAMQIFNILATSVVVHAVIVMAGQVRKKNSQLEETNAELTARDEEISRQNEELQSQSEELVQQNEELEHQAEELQAQGEELQTLNSELTGRQQVVEGILNSVKDSTDERQLINQICRAVAPLLGADVKAVAVVEKTGDEVTVQTWAGESVPCIEKWPFAGSFTSVIMEQKRTAFVKLKDRPDFTLSPKNGLNFQSILATPLRLKGRIAGAVKACSVEEREWNREHFQLIEWVAAQCSMALDIMRLRKELQVMNESLELTVEERTAELREMVEELEHFSYTITHDMRAPLRAIHGFAGMLEETNGVALRPEAKECLGHIMRSVQRMDRLIVDALSYSKAVRQEMAAVPVDTAELLRGIIHSYPVLQSPRANIDLDPSLPRVLGNEAGLTQCFANLLTNAVKFVRPGTVPHVRVRADRGDGAVRIWFEDNGIGIAPETKKHLFKMFQRGSKDYEGTGIGLALVRKVAARMKGRVGVESTPGKGSRFWIELPPAHPLGQVAARTGAHSPGRTIAM
jgi:signal transduction histidine kinase